MNVSCSVRIWVIVFTCILLTGCLDSKKIIIQGVIANPGEFKTEKAYLQIVPEECKVKMDIEGRIMEFASVLDKIDFPRDGVFRITIGKLEPGRYMIAAQHLVPTSILIMTTPWISLPLRSKKDEQVAIFEIPKNYDLPMKIDLGQVYIP